MGSRRSQLSGRGAAAGAYGLGVDYRPRQEIRAFFRFEHAVYERGYLAAQRAPGATRNPTLTVDEQALGLELGCAYDVAPLFLPGWFGLYLSPRLSLRYAQLVGESFPATLFGVAPGLELGLWPSPSFRIEVGADYAYDLGPLIAAPEPHSAGEGRGLTRAHASLGFFLEPHSFLSVGYRAAVLTLEHDRFVAHDASLALTFFVLPR